MPSGDPESERRFCHWGSPPPKHKGLCNPPVAKRAEQEAVRSSLSFSEDFRGDPGS